MNKKNIIILILSIISCQLTAQNIEEDRILIPMISANLGYNHPGGDFAERFNGSGQVGAAFKLKFKSNLFVGLEGNYLFSQGIKDPEYRDYLENEDGWITNFYGEPGILAEKLDGFVIAANLGYIIPVLNPNPNSGIMISGGIGFTQHKIWIEERQNNIPQLSDEYIKGYDRLCNGLMTNQFIGYMFFQKKAVWNFYAGLEFTQGFTQNRRSWDFIEKRKIDEKRLDLLYSIKVGWVISLHKRMATEIYYY